MIKLVVSDVDGTLREEGTGHEQPEVIEMVNKLADKGIVFAFASGRSYEGIVGTFPELENVAVFISNNGACVTEKGKTIVSYEMSRELVTEVVEYIRNVSGSSILVTTERYSYTESKDEEFIQWIIEGYRTDLQCVDDVLTDIHEPILKIAMFIKGVDAATAQVEAKAKFDGRLSVMGAGRHWVDFIRDDVDKGNAVKELQKKLNISSQETMTFGDNLNDIGLMKCAVHSFAVYNSRTETKEAAAEILPEGENAVLDKLAELL